MIGREITKIEGSMIWFVISAVTSNTSEFCLVVGKSMDIVDQWENTDFQLIVLVFAIIVKQCFHARRITGIFFILDQGFYSY